MSTRDYIKPRAYDKRVRFEQLAVTAGTLGGAKRVWGPLYGGRSFWASIVDVRGRLRRETSVAGGSIPDASYIIETRWHSLVVPDSVRVVCGSEVFTIKFVEDTHRQKDRMILHCDIGARGNG